MYRDNVPPVSQINKHPAAPPSLTAGTVPVSSSDLIRQVVLIDVKYRLADWRCPSLSQPVEHLSSFYFLPISQGGLLLELCLIPMIDPLFNTIENKGKKSGLHFMDGEI